jgi:hypothetical protein
LLSLLLLLQLLLFPPPLLLLLLLLPQATTHKEQGCMCCGCPSPEPELAELQCAALDVVLHTPWCPHHHINTLQQGPQQQQQAQAPCMRDNTTLTLGLRWCMGDL